MVFLVSPAFGRPSSAKLEVGSEAVNQLEFFISFTNGTGNIFQDSTLTESVVESLLEAEKSILEMEVQLKTLQSEVVEEQQFYSAYNEAKSYVRKTRQELRKLADRTVTEVRDLKILLEALDESNDYILLKESIDKMKDLIIETLGTLEEAREKYNSAVRTFEDHNSAVKTENTKLTKMLTQDSAEHQAWVAKVTEGVEEANNGTDKGSCDKYKWVGKICSFFGHRSEFISLETALADYESELRELKSITDRMLESGNNFDRTVKEAIGILTDEIEPISEWTQSFDGENIEKYSKEYLDMYISIRTAFKNGLDDLTSVAEDFLAQPIDIE